MNDPNHGGNEEDPATAVAEDIAKNRASGAVTSTTLDVDSRVFARITDGIYRQPWAALRELISNAYDADATEVTILTDVPRFDRITIRDNGEGMDDATFAHFTKHIGGSSKRTFRGKALGTVDPNDVTLSPKGRRLIGKIGIGLFAVAQMTQHLQIITKREGAKYRLSAEIRLKTYSEESMLHADGKFESGNVDIVSIDAADVDTHGTEIILLNLREQARQSLKSEERWLKIAKELQDPSLPDNARTERPTFHVGFADAASDESFSVEPKLPWSFEDDPADKFRALYRGVIGDERRSNPSIELALDNYLRTIWLLSLAAPVSYVDGNPFEITSADNVDLYTLTERPREPAQPLSVPPGKSVGAHLGLSESVSEPVGKFAVVLDGIELLRPIRLERSVLGKTQSIPRPLLFLSKHESSLGDFPSDLAGGHLSFELYIYWNGAILPKENNGVLIRINNASGSPFDKTFFDYPAHDNRLKQLSAEVFITRGLDAALNIDRESYNYSHPHHQYLVRYVHLCVRKVINRLKSLGAEYHDKRQLLLRDAVASRTDQLLEQIWAKRRGADNSEPPSIVVLEADAVNDQARSKSIVLVRQNSLRTAATTRRAESQQTLDVKAAAITSVLAAYELVDDMAFSVLQELVQDLLSVLEHG